jgi:hypothetical protein
MKNEKKKTDPLMGRGTGGLVGYPTTYFKLQVFKRMFDGIL